MEDSFTASSSYIEQQAVRAVAALASPTWTSQVIGTAAALVAENAQRSCAQQIMHQVMHHAAESQLYASLLYLR